MGERVYRGLISAMMKFFRKNLKSLLAVFMCLLLLVWLGGHSLTYLLFHYTC